MTMRKNSNFPKTRVCNTVLQIGKICKIIRHDSRNKCKHNKPIIHQCLITKTCNYNFRDYTMTTKVYVTYLQCI